MRPDKRFYEMLGAKISRIRISKGLSIRRLSELLGDKYSRTTLSRYESGDPNIANALDDICEVLGVNANELWDETAKDYAFDDMIRDSLEEANQKKRLTLKEYYDDETIDFADQFSKMTGDERKELHNYADYIDSKKK